MEQQLQTAVESFGFFEPEADGFRNYQKTRYALSADEPLVDETQLLTLTAPEVTALVAGMRVLNANVDRCKHGVFISRQLASTNDFPSYALWPRFMRAST